MNKFLITMISFIISSCSYQIRDGWDVIALLGGQAQDEDILDYSLTITQQK